MLDDGTTGEKVFVGGSTLDESMTVPAGEREPSGCDVQLAIDKAPIMTKINAARLRITTDITTPSRDAPDHTPNCRQGLPTRSMSASMVCSSKLTVRRCPVSTSVRAASGYLIMVAIAE